MVKVKGKSRYQRKVVKRGQIYGRAGYQLYKDVNYLRTLINSELHNVIYTYSGSSVSNTAVLSSVSTISQGDTIATRSGDKVLPRYLSGNLCWENGSAATAGVQDDIRFTIFIWKDNTTPTQSDIYANNTPFSHLADKNSGNGQDRKMVILYTKNFSLINGTERQARNMKFNIQLNHAKIRRKMHIGYDGATSTPYMNGIYIYYLGTNSATDVSTLSGEIKMSFHDN